ncbi:MAG: NADP-specific glutamate dehydrogenase [Erysipelotrichaceae bacterium]
MINSYVEKTIANLSARYPEQREFIQAVSEVLTSVSMVFDLHPEYETYSILERITEPERAISFKVVWKDDMGKIQVNRGYRIQFNGVLGPYKGGLRFNPTVNLSVLKFLAFEQTFKNALTTLPLGGGKGGSDFDPKGKSDNEIMRFCESFMMELYRHIDQFTDVPAGDMGVGAREINYLYGAYRRLRGNHELGVLTGKTVGYGGSLLRTEATGYGLLYFVLEMANYHNIKLEGLRTIVSGSGNVGIYAALKAQELGMKVVGISDSQGYIIDEDLDLIKVKDIKEKHLSLSEYGSCYYKGSIYDSSILVDVALPCGKENEIDLKRAENLVNNGLKLLAEGANMPTTFEVANYFKDHNVIYAIGKASNAGGVATSGIEMSQNSMRMYFEADQVDQMLKKIMHDIHQQIVDTIVEYDLDKNDYLLATNICAFNKVVKGMIMQGEY